ncbi:ABC transporter permease [Listeria kieliensis]
MNTLITWGKVHLLNWNKIFRLAKFDKKAMHQNHFFGLFWEFLSPALQIIIYYVVFGLRLGGHAVLPSGVPYLYWMLIGIIPWFYMSSSIVSGAASIYSNLGLLSKTAFPVEILPTISVIKGLNSFFTMFGLFLILYVGSGFYPTLKWLQLIYYFLLTVLFLMTISLFTSVITVVFRDFQLIINSAMRLLFFISGAVIDVTANENSILTKLFKLNPFVYLVEGFRDALLSREWFFEKTWWTIYFFSIMLFILLMGVYLMNHYKSKFTEYM